ncbi:hypothetical protein ASG89_11800 [Paenibacillus sp. Soil766]|uniref:hypothetical protein n=1 Tax=Paenibacillus sp. Soil766 TaxID=1736404 RepID=UPI0007149445|nr:hypothetical protein [Paenibacillus sp. Soil766]KRE83796.1 hypothetical protein ASG89_11800 [Paenibacillus sp. Soil766]
MGKQEQHNRSREGVNMQEERKWYSLIDKIWAKPNMEEAFKEVKRNRGAVGIDRTTIKAFESKLEHHLEVLQQALKARHIALSQFDVYTSRKQMERKDPWAYLPWETELYKPR